MRIAAFALCLLAAPAFAAPPLSIPDDTAQLLVVITKDWGSTAGTLRRLERVPRDPARPFADHFRPVGEPIPVVVGRTGLAWGVGLHTGALAKSLGGGGPQKREGDGRSPAGLFRLTAATGYAAAPPAGTKLEYRQATDRLRCVDDPKSPAYNTLAMAPESGPPPWSSDERMRRGDDLYAWTIFVAHNTPPEAGGGSCIFLHLSRDASAPTVGCTAMARTDIEALLTWLDPAMKPLLLQLPSRAYRDVARAARLPQALN